MASIFYEDKTMSSLLNSVNVMWCYKNAKSIYNLLQSRRIVPIHLGFFHTIQFKENYFKVTSNFISLGPTPRGLRLLRPRESTTDCILLNGLIQTIWLSVHLIAFFLSVYLDRVSCQIGNNAVRIQHMKSFILRNLISLNTHQFTCECMIIF